MDNSHLIDSCWEVIIHRSALAFPTIILHDNVTELRRSMFLAANPSDCFRENTRFRSVKGEVSTVKIKTIQNVGSIEKCRELCLRYEACVLFFLVQDGDCFLRKDRHSVMGQKGTTSGLKHCGTLYYENDGSVATGSQQTATFAKNLESISLALSDGSYKVKRCHPEKSKSCYVLIKFKS